MNILNEIEKGASHIENLKSQVLKANKIQLHSGLEGFESPESFGIYRNTGGKPLGVVGNTFEPCDLVLFLDSIHQSILKSGLDLDISKIKYTEYFDGSKICFTIPYRSSEIKTRMVGDLVDFDFYFKTGFDGKTTQSITFFGKRVWCDNQSANWQKDIDLNMRNTKGNALKLPFFVSEILKIAEMAENYVEGLNNLVKKPIKQSVIDKFLTELTGYDVKDYSTLKTRQRNTLDTINKNIAIEIQNTGDNMFSLLQGITRYTTHDLAEGNKQSILFATPAKMNADAHRFAFSFN
jgi:hypothetical protein